MTTGNRTASSKTKPFEFQNWTVYEKSICLAKQAHEIGRSMPKGETRSLVDQWRRASQSIPLNIAEGSSRYGAKEKTNFLRIAKGSLFECVAVVDLGRELEFVQESKCEQFQKDAAEVGKMLSGLIRSLEKRKG